MQSIKDQFYSVLSSYAQHPCSFLCLNNNIEYFTCSEVEGLIAYRFAGKHCIVVIGGVIAAKEKRRVLWSAFESFAGQLKRKVITVHFSKEDIGLLDFERYRINQIGASYAIGLEGYKINGKQFATLRNKISRAKRKGVTIVEVSCENNLDNRWRQQINEVDEEWLKEKGKSELDFMIGELNLSVIPSEKKLYLAIQDDFLLGYVQYSKTYGDLRGWMHDLSRRRQKIPIGTMEYLNLTALKNFQNQSDKFLHFGFTPFTGLQEDLEFKPAASKLVSKLVRFLFHYGKIIYPAKSQLQYKNTWRPTVVIPEYIAFEGGYDMRSLFSFLKMVNAI